MSKSANARVRIPNFDTLSTLLDRLSIENVKLAHFENALAHDNPGPEACIALQQKADTQNLIIQDLKRETTRFLEDTFSEGAYVYRKEERTFQ